MTDNLERIAEALERIAIALEKIESAGILTWLGEPPPDEN